MPRTLLEREIEQLAKASQRINDGERRIALHRDLIEQRRANGLPTEDYEQMLVLFISTLAGWESHRTLSVHSIERLLSGHALKRRD